MRLSFTAMTVTVRCCKWNQAKFGSRLLVVMLANWLNTVVKCKVISHNCGCLCFVSVQLHGVYSKWYSVPIVSYWQSHETCSCTGEAGLGSVNNKIVSHCIKILKICPKMAFANVIQFPSWVAFTMRHYASTVAVALCLSVHRKLDLLFCDSLSVCLW